MQKMMKTFEMTPWGFTKFYYVLIYKGKREKEIKFHTFASSFICCANSF